MLARIFQLKLFMAMRPALAALLMLVLALTGTGDFEPLARDTWKSQNSLETLWATTNSRYVVTTKMQRRHCRPSADLAPWSPQVLGRPPTAAEAAASAFIAAGPDGERVAPHPTTSLRLMAPSSAARLAVTQDVPPSPVVYHDLRAPPLAA